MSVKPLREKEISETFYQSESRQISKNLKGSQATSDDPKKLLKELEMHNQLLSLISTGATGPEKKQVEETRREILSVIDELIKVIPEDKHNIIS